MRLIDVKTCEIREFFGDNIPKYAILSHTWGEDEVALQDMGTIRGMLTNGLDSTSWSLLQKSSYRKILNTCQQAIQDGLRWAWIDTCCIDKSSSAELSEAINSMFQWYRSSTQCYAYLSDVRAPSISDPSQIDSSMRLSRWFKRGWTLQELIAPRRMKFYAQKWRALGSREDRSGIISEITHIPQHILGDGRYQKWSLDDFSVAQKMSWASGRQCTRVEDTAYSLLGIFGINMPLLYGEGEKAFLRLQEEIFRATDDHSLLAWTADDERSGWQQGSVFANSPRNFSDSGQIVRLHEEMGGPSLATKKGLQISLHLEEGSSLSSRIYQRYCPGATFHAILNCGERRLEKTIRILLLLVRDEARDQVIKPSHCYSRVLTLEHMGVHDQTQFQDPSTYQTIFLRTHRHKFHRIYPRSTVPSAVRIHAHRFPLVFQSTFDDPSSQGLVKGIQRAYYGHLAYVLEMESDEYTTYDGGNTMTDVVNSFTLELHLRSHIGLPALRARCEVQRDVEGRDYVQLWLNWKTDGQTLGVWLSRAVQTSQFVNIASFRGDLISASLAVEDAIVTIAIKCTASWDEGSDVPPDEDRVYFHIHVSTRLASWVQASRDLIDLRRQMSNRELSSRCWRAEDFFSLFADFLDLLHYWRTIKIRVVQLELMTKR